MTSCTVPKASIHKLLSKLQSISLLAATCGLYLGYVTGLRCRQHVSITPHLTSKPQCVCKGPVSHTGDHIWLSCMGMMHCATGYACCRPHQTYHSKCGKIDAASYCIVEQLHSCTDATSNDQNALHNSVYTSTYCLPHTTARRYDQYGHTSSCWPATAID